MTKSLKDRNIVNFFKEWRPKKQHIHFCMCFESGIDDRIWRNFHFIFNYRIRANLTSTQWEKGEEFNPIRSSYNNRHLVQVTFPSLPFLNCEGQAIARQRGKKARETWHYCFCAVLVKKEEEEDKGEKKGYVSIWFWRLREQETHNSCGN